MGASRFEYRIFAPGLAWLRKRLAEETEPCGRDASADLYLLGRRRDRNVKVRDGCLDIKELREVYLGLERWVPTERVPFPLPGSWIRTRLAGQLGLERLESPRATYALDALRDEILAPMPGLACVQVSKQRERFVRGSLWAEFARVRLGGRPSDTVALESEAPGIVVAWVGRLALDGWPNTSYVTALRPPRVRQGTSREAQA